MELQLRKKKKIFIFPSGNGVTVISPRWNPLHGHAMRGKCGFCLGFQRISFETFQNVCGSEKNVRKCKNGGTRSGAGSSLKSVWQSSARFICWDLASGGPGEAKTEELRLEAELGFTLPTSKNGEKGG